MSTPDPDTEEPRASRSILDLVLWVGVPIAAAGVIMAAIVAETTTIDRDLELVVSPELEPGRRAAVRALLLTGFASEDGPVLATASGHVSLRDRSGRSLAKTKLSATKARSMEALLAVPPDARGSLELSAVVYAADGAEITVRAPVHVRAGATRLDAGGRLAFALQHLALGPVLAAGTAPPPSVLDVRVPGGTCRPEIPCELLVRVGEPLAEVSIATTASVTPRVRPRPTGNEIASLQRLTIVTHGPEAASDVIATRDGVEVARRTLQLPVDLSVPVLRVARSLLEAPARPRIAVAGTEQGRGVILDAFRDGHWERTSTLAPSLVGGDPLPLATEPLDAGLWRLQARTDPLGTSSAASRLIHVRRAGTNAADALRELARSRAREDTEARAWASAMPADAARDPDLFAQWLLAHGEGAVVAQPPAARGRPQELAALEKRRMLLRGVAVIALVLLGAFVAAMLVRRGLEASAQARDVLEAAGDESAKSARTRRLMTATVLAMALAVALAFAAAAAFVVLRMQAA